MTKVRGFGRIARGQRRSALRTGSSRERCHHGVPDRAGTGICLRVADPVAAASGLCGPGGFRLRGTLEWLVNHPESGRWKLWLCALAWCVLALAFAAVMFWAALKSFDRCLGRMPETIVSGRYLESAVICGIDDHWRFCEQVEKLESVNHRGTDPTLIE
jgi:hypothetical protein